MSPAALDRASRLFRAMGDPARLRLLALLSQGEACVSELAAAENEQISTISQRLRVLRAEDLVSRKRRGKHINYALADQHVVDLIFNALAHSSELPARPVGEAQPEAEVSGSLDEGPDEEEDEAHAASAISRPGSRSGEDTMSHRIHEAHSHVHGAGCGHTAVEHNGHVDYLHDGCLHSAHGDHYDEHSIEVSAANPAECTPSHACGAHDTAHKHGPGCGHEAVPHGDHVDYLVNGHLHHPHGTHCDDHGKLALA